MKSTLRISQKGFILVAAPLFFETVFLLVVANLLVQAESEAAKAEQARLVVNEANRMIAVSYDLQSALFGYVSTGNLLLRKRYDRAAITLPNDMRRFISIVRNEPRQLHAVERMAVAANDLVDMLDEVRDSVAHTDFAKLSSLQNRIPELQRVEDELITELRIFAEQEAAREKGRPELVSQKRAQLKMAIGVGVVLNAIVAFGLAVFFNSGTLKRLNILMDNSLRLAKKQELNPKLNGNDEIAQLDAVFHDMAHTLEESARKEKEAIEYTAKMKQAFVATVSHELRTPLNAVESSLTLLASGMAGDLPEVAKRKVEIAERNIARSISLISDLLDIEKLESGTLKLVMEPSEVDVFVYKALDSVEALAEERKISIEVHNSIDEIVADGDRLTQVLVNFLSNALKYSPEDSTIDVTVERGESGVRFAVRDHGKGIPEDMREVIFERFAQVTAQDGKPGTGWGLGLSICKAIIESHGGTIGVAEAPGGGSIFWFCLPEVREQLGSDS